MAHKMAASLRSNTLLTRDTAAIEAGASCQAVNQAMWRWRQGKASEAESEICEVIHLAVQKQVQDLLQQGLTAFASGQRTGYIEFLAKKKDPINYGDKTSLEVSGPDGTSLKYDLMSPAELRAEAEKLLGGTPILVLEAPKEEVSDE